MHTILTRLGAICLLLMVQVTEAADLPRVHVFVTQRAPVVDRLLEDVGRAVEGLARLEVTDLKGSIGGANDAAQAIASALKTGDLVLALGAPAARAAVQKISGHPLVCAMTTPAAVGALSKPDAPVYFAGGDPSVDALVSALSAVWKNTGRIAVIADARAGAPMPAGHGKVIWHRVGSHDDLLSELDALAADVDGFVFPREATVLNRRNLEEVVQWLSRNGKPAIGYSRFLVTAGFPAAVGADDQSSRRRVVDILTALLRGEAVPEAHTEGAIWLNRKSLQSFGIDPGKLDVAAQLL